MKTRKIILIRHGEYNNDEGFHLSDYGKNQMQNLATNLLPEIENKKVIFISSMANRAFESAEILQSVWKEKSIELPLDKHYEIWSGTDGSAEKRRLKVEEEKEISVYDFDWLQKFIEESDCDVVVAVTHLEFVEDFPGRLGFGYGNGPGKGSAKVLNLETKHSKLVHP